eukprot:TRINITY_DN68099_c2_g16_i1.p1 TRINITY_DN68099_c2_g16~~TRINITY_DN68099_c2_g16_i1.p1  ORF type:complete len:302 (-),score=26.31 TRINITY_DN68099_c2_g16_i1:99-965(-)
MDEIVQLLEAKDVTVTQRQGSKLQTSRGPIFVKIGTGGASADVSLLEYEAKALEHLSNAAKNLHIPKPVLFGALKNGSGFLCMEHLTLGGSGSQKKLGEGLAEMHLSEPQYTKFGFPVDGCCGACPQYNNTDGKEMNWVDFWKEFRLGSQLEMLKQNAPRDTEIQQLGKQLIDYLPNLFSMLDVSAIKPSVLHGDLWSGNFGFDSDGQPCIFDPACYYGHHEADLGIARMFGGFSSEFWNAYHAKIPKAPGFDKRALLYELHHHLNHYNIFGSGYRGGALDLMRRILR